MKYQKKLRSLSITEKNERFLPSNFSILSEKNYFIKEEEGNKYQKFKKIIFLIIILIFVLFITLLCILSIISVKILLKKKKSFFLLHYN
jgi:cell division septal protein FtsQ